MVANWFYSLTACALCAGFAPAQFRPCEGPATPPVNKLTPPAGIRPVAGVGEEPRVRVAPPRTLDVAPQEIPRLGYNQSPSTYRVIERNLAPQERTRINPAEFRVQPGDKVNKIANPLPQRNLAPNASERITPPQAPSPQRFHADNPPAERIRDR